MSSYSIPGDMIASIEEYESGQNTFNDGDKVRSAVVGMIKIDKKQRIVSIEDPKKNSIPRVGDTIIGTVAAIMSSMIIVSIKFINGHPITSEVECVCPTKHLRKRTVALLNDVVILKIISHINGAIHASITESDLGILFTKCRKCGMKVIQIRDAIKCTECGWIDDRKLSSSFGNKNLIKVCQR